MNIKVLVGRDFWSIELDVATKTATVVAIEPHSTPKPVRGLGDVIAAATSAVGIKPCGGCKQRQEALNKLIPFGNANEEGKNDGTPSV
jgi:hypothetical protein